MTPKPAECRDIELDLVAAAAGDADVPAARRVDAHVGRCGSCRDELARYRAIDRVVGTLRGGSPAADRVARAREALESRLADFRRRLLVYGVFDSPLGELLIARSEEGVALVRYLAGGRAPRLAAGPAAGIELEEDPASVEAFHRELLAYLRGDRTRLDWPLDLRCARSDFHRDVLRATAEVPYGAVTSYAAIARGIGKPRAVRAVAQALRWNPLPIVIPCHRIVGSSGALTGYAGHRVALKRSILGVEGVPTRGDRADGRVLREATYVRYRCSTEYCLPTCGTLSTRTLADLTLFGSRERAERLGLVPCGDCRPDLHPLSA